MIPNEWLQFAPKPKELRTGEEWNVFLSYRAVNRSWVLGLYDVLFELGYKVFIDQYGLKAGDNLITSLQNALEKSQTGILVWSEALQDSDWNRMEYNNFERRAAEDKQFHFVCVKLGNVKLPIIVRNRIFIDFTDYPDGPNGGELIRLLYAIANEPLSNEASRFVADQDEDSKNQAAKVNAAIKNNNPERLKQLFEKGGLAWKTSAALGCKAAEGLIKLRRYEDALDMLEILESQFKKALRPRQLKALVLTRRGESGDLELAQEILGEMFEKNQMDSETMGIYGRTWMDRYKKSSDINHLKQSRDLYAQAFEKSPDDYYAGINAASKSVLIGTEEDLKKAADYAQKVEKITGKNEVPDDYWKTATIAETFLLQKKYKEAGEMYAKAVAMARSERGSQESTYLQARELMDKLNPTKGERQMIDVAFSDLQGQELSRKVKAFISYSHKDVAHLEELLLYLSPLEQSGKIEFLLDRKIQAGELWAERLDQFIHEADIIIFLVSPDSLTSAPINSEVQTAVKQFEKGISIVIPILIRPTSWDSTPLFTFQFLSFDKGALSIEKTSVASDTKQTWYLEFIEAFKMLISEVVEDWFTRIRPELNQRTGILDLSGCNLSAIPWIVSKMNWLRSLKFSNNNISDIKRLENLTDLRNVDLSSNMISDTEGLNGLTELISIDLSVNKILNGSDLTAKPNLITLILKNNLLTNIPDLSGLPRLQHLDLSDNQIGHIEITGDPLGLTYMNLSKNKLNKIEGIDRLVSIADLRLTDNRVERIEGLNSLLSLEYLDLFNNQISEIEGLENNKNLKFLGLSSNRITELKNIAHLQKLETLYIAHNSIENIRELQGLYHLKRVVLTDNKIIDLIHLKRFIENDIPVKAEYSFDESEPGFFVKDNPIQYPPLEVLMQGKDAILRNFKQQEEALQEKLEPYQSNDIKLILIGNANVGKSHIATYIKSKKKDLPMNNASTHGMVNEFAEYHTPSPVKIRILDFGGQEYYHDTHHLFFTTDTIYLLLWEKDTNKFGVRTEKRYSINTGKQEDETNAIFPVAYWLDAVNYFITKKEKERSLLQSGQIDNTDSTATVNIDPSVILVETKRDKKGGTLLDTASILSYRGIIHSQVAISLYRDEKNKIVSTGADSLFDSLNNLAGSMFEKRWSGYYKLIVSFFEDIDSPSSLELIKEVNAGALIINLQNCIILFDKIIRSHNFKYKFDDDDGVDLCRFLANRGYILYFDNNKICLHPERLTKEIYAILNKEYKNIGIITGAEASGHDLEVLNIMQEFKLLIPHPGGKSFIAPQLLPEEISSQVKMFLEAFKSPVLRFSISGYIHKNIIQELFYSFKDNLIKEDTQNYIWKNGFIATIGNDLYKINISSSEDSRMIEIQYLNSLNMVVLNDISTAIIKVLGNRPFKKEVSLDGKLFVPTELILKNIQLSQFVHEGKLLRVAEYKNFLDTGSKKYAMKKLFISYSSKNTAFMRRFETHLGPLKRNGTIDFWHDRMIEPGARWDESIKMELRLSDIVIFLLSPDFIATDYIFEVEIPQALEQFKNQPGKLFFVELQSCSWDQTILSQYQQTVDPAADNKGVILISDSMNDIQWKKVVTELQKKIDLII